MNGKIEVNGKIETLRERRPGAARTIHDAVELSGDTEFPLLPKVPLAKLADIFQNFHF